MKALPIVLALGAVVALVAAGGSGGGASTGKAKAPIVGEQVDKLLAEFHTKAELETAATMLTEAGFTKEAAAVRKAIEGKRRITFPGLADAARGSA